MGLKFKLFKKPKKEKKLFVVGYDCGIDDWEFTEIVLANNFSQAIQYAENSATELYEDMDLAPSLLEFGIDCEDFDKVKNECLLNAIGFWCREFDEEKDQDLIQSLGIIEIM